MSFSSQKKFSKPLLYLLIAYTLIYFIWKILFPMFSQRPDLGTDFTAYYAAGKFVLNGENIYRSSDNHTVIYLSEEEQNTWGLHRKEISPYIYPSFLAIALSPLTLMNFQNALLVWKIFSLLFFILNIYLLFKCLKLKFEINFSVVLILFIFFTASATMENFLSGQVNLLLMSLILFSYLFNEKGIYSAAGLFLACAILIKLIPAVLLLYFLLRKDYKTFLYSIVFVFVILLSVNIFISPYDLDYITNVLPAVSLNKPELNNKSYLVWWKFIFNDNDFVKPLTNLPSSPIIIFITTSIALVTAVIVKFRKNIKAAVSENNFYLFAIFLCLMLLLNPYLQIPHLIFAFVPLAVVIGFYKEGWNWKRLLTVAIIFILINNRGENAFEKLGYYWWNAFLTTPQIYGLLILFFLFLSFPRRRESR